MAKKQLTEEEREKEAEEVIESDLLASNAVKNLTKILGVGKAMAVKLYNAGFKDHMSIAVRSPKDLSDHIDGLSEDGAAKIIEEAQKMLNIGDFISTDVLIEKRKRLMHLTTSSPQLDSLFGGKGLETGSITEFYGEFGTGKCVGKDTPIIYFVNNEAHIDSISNIFNKYMTDVQLEGNGEAYKPKQTIELLSFDADNGIIIKQKMNGMYRERVTEIEELKTDRGNILQITKNHPLLTLSENGLEWKSVGLLHKGDVIAVPKEAGFESENILTEDDAYFLGIFVSEGCANPLSISNTSEKIKNKIVDYSIKKFGRVATKDNYDRILLYKEFRTILGDLANCKSDTKYIPDSVMNSNNNIAAAFLAGYLDGDGHYGDAIEFVTKSKKLMIQMNYLLLKLGINTSISNKIVNNELYYRTFITEPQAKIKLNKLLKETTKNIDNLKTKNKSYKYGIPSKQFHNIYKQVFLNVSGTHRHATHYNKKDLLNGKYGVVYSNYLAKNKISANEITFESANLILEFLESRINCMKIWQEKLQNPSQEIILEALKELPFKSNEICKEANIKKSTFNNYITRKTIPNDNVVVITNTLLKMIQNVLIDKQIYKNMNTLKMLCRGDLVWETIESMETKKYDDYVYDLMVENTHNFIGGEKPTILHNTQICLQLAVNATTPVEQGGLDGHVLWIDTEGTYRPERIYDIASAMNLVPEEVYKKIHVARAFNSAHQILLLEKKAINWAELFPIRLVIVDSLTAHFRSEFIGRSNLGERQGLLNKHMHDLLRFADINNAVVVVTNQVITNAGQLFGDPTKPVGGNIVGHTSTYRVYLRKGKAGKKVARMIDSPANPDEEVLISVGKEGIRDG